MQIGMGREDHYALNVKHLAIELVHRNYIVEEAAKIENGSFSFHGDGVYEKVQGAGSREVTEKERKIFAIAVRKLQRASFGSPFNGATYVRQIDSVFDIIVRHDTTNDKITLNLTPHLDYPVDWEVREFAGISKHRLEATISRWQEMIENDNVLAFAGPPEGDCGRHVLFKPDRIEKLVAAVAQTAGLAWPDRA